MESAIATHLISLNLAPTQYSIALTLQTSSLMLTEPNLPSVQRLGKTIVLIFDRTFSLGSLGALLQAETGGHSLG